MGKKSSGAVKSKKLVKTENRFKQKCSGVHVDLVSVEETRLGVIDTLANAILTLAGNLDPPSITIRDSLFTGTGVGVEIKNPPKTSKKTIDSDG